MYNNPRESIDRVCVECGAPLDAKAISCACGWGKSKPRRRAEESSPDCGYEANGQRCRYPGAISLGVLGGGPWFCRIHIRERGTLLAQQCLEQSQSYGPPRTNDDLKDLNWLAKNFPMQLGETRAEYNLRCRDKALTMKGYKPKSVVAYASREPGEDD